MMRASFHEHPAFPPDDSNATQWQGTSFRFVRPPATIGGAQMSINPSAERSLEEGLEETLTIHRLGIPLELRRSLRSINPIEFTFSRVRTDCRNVKRWRPGNQRERWIGSALTFAEQKFRRIVGYKALPKLVAILDARKGNSKAFSHVA
ncbi:MAG: hypothetical protein JO159_01475 [Acidobacteria bacterium]|nr:hypothetical protein [Acidobacteriota bacterium]